MNVLTGNDFPKIIDFIAFLGDSLMGWLEYLGEMVSLVGVPGVVIVMWAVMPILILTVMTMIFASIQKQSKNNEKALSIQIESLTNAISMLTVQVQNPPLTVEDALDYYHLVMGNHVMRKLRYLGGILRKNSIHSRTTQIKKNISKEFKAITTSECSKLSKKKTVCGDMGKIVQDNINWDKFLTEIYRIFFVKISKKEEEHLKIQDIEIAITSEVDRISKIIEDNGVHN